MVADIPNATPKGPPKSFRKPLKGVSVASRLALIQTVKLTREELNSVLIGFAMDVVGIHTPARVDVRWDADTAPRWVEIDIVTEEGEPT